MIARPVTHLFPSVDSVAIGAEQPQVALVRLPISQAIIPGARATLFERPVDVVNVEHAVVGLTADHARTPKVVHDRQLPLPVSRMLVLLVAVDRPVSIATANVAKAVLAGLPAVLARPSSLPSGSEVAVAPAILPGSVPQPIEVGFKRLAAIAASYLNCALFHVQNITWNWRRTKYFDIACKRIDDAQRQGDFFVSAA